MWHACLALCCLCARRAPPSLRKAFHHLVWTEQAGTAQYDTPVPVVAIHSQPDLPQVRQRHAPNHKHDYGGAVTGLGLLLDQPKPPKPALQQAPATEHNPITASAKCTPLLVKCLAEPFSLFVQCHYFKCQLLPRIKLRCQPRAPS